jgi:hypothetical protein
MRLLLSILAWLIFGLTIDLSSAFPVSQAHAIDVKAVIDDLRQGGYVIYFRHGATGPISFDRPTAVMGDCSSATRTTWGATRFANSGRTSRR